MHPRALQLASSDPGSELRLDFSHASWWQARVAAHSGAKDFHTLSRQSFLLGLQQKPEDVVSGVDFRMRGGMVVSLCVAECETAPHARSLFHLFATRSLCARREAEVCESASDSGGLGILETGDCIYVAVAFSFRCPPCCGGERLRAGPIHQCPKGDLPIAPSDKLGVDAALGIARIKQLDSLGDRRVLVRTEGRIGLRHQASREPRGFPSYARTKAESRAILVVFGRSSRASECHGREPANPLFCPPSTSPSRRLLRRFHPRPRKDL